MQFRKWPHYLRERKPRHLRLNGSSGPKTPLACMALIQTTSPQVERGALGLDSPHGRITHTAIQTETNYTPTMTNESAHVPKRGNHLGGIQV